MLSLDRRSRTAGDRLNLTVDESLARALPALLGGPHRDLALRAVASIGLEPVLLTVEDRTVVLDAPALAVRSVSDDGRDDQLDHLTATEYGLSRVLTDQTSISVLMLEGELSLRRGPIDLWVRFEPVLRALLSGWEAYEPGSIELVDRRGDPLDVHRVFTPDDDRADVAHFLSQAGFLHIRGCFTAAQVELLQRECEHVLASVTPLDDQAETNRTSSGEEVVIAVRDVAARWPGLTEVLATPSFASLGTVAPGTTWFAPITGTVQHKGFDIAEGFTNTPWHRDCGPGGHSYKCCVFRAGIALSRDHDGTGRFGVIAGSHRANVSANPLALPRELPKLMLDCEPGDVHVHLSCTFHCGTAATTAHRRVLYTDFLLPGTSSMDNDRAYRDGKISAAVGGAVAATANLSGL